MEQIGISRGKMILKQTPRETTLLLATDKRLVDISGIKKGLFLALKDMGVKVEDE